MLHEHRFGQGTYGMGQAQKTLDSNVGPLKACDMILSANGASTPNTWRIEGKQAANSNQTSVKPLLDPYQPLLDPYQIPKKTIRHLDPTGEPPASLLCAQPVPQCHPVYQGNSIDLNRQPLETTESTCQHARICQRFIAKPKKSSITQNLQESARIRLTSYNLKTYVCIYIIHD